MKKFVLELPWSNFTGIFYRNDQKLEHSCEIPVLGKSLVGVIFNKDFNRKDIYCNILQSLFQKPYLFKLYQQLLIIDLSFLHT